jgi:hypothetical protein
MIMKKLIQIGLVLVLIVGLFQFVPTAPTTGTVSSSVTISADLRSTTLVEDTQMAGCLVLLKRVICVVPNVGWNT